MRTLTVYSSLPDMSFSRVIYKFCVTKLFLVLSFVLFSNFCNSKSLFYQPQLADMALSFNDWEEQLGAARRAGYTSIILQWVQYGNVTFYDSDILKHISKAPSSKYFDFWIGLYMPEDYYQVMESSGHTKYKYIEQILNRNTVVLATLDLYGFNHQFRIKGWYLPLEISSSYLVAEERSKILQRLKSWQKGISKPVGISYFVGYQNDLERSVKDMSELSESGFTTFLQRSNGILQAVDINPLFSKLDCDGFIVTEAFKESKEGKFVALTNLPAMNSCHNQAVFSLRYLPFARFKKR